MIIHISNHRIVCWCANQSIKSFNIYIRSLVQGHLSRSNAQWTSHSEAGHLPGALHQGSLLVQVSSNGQAACCAKGCGACWGLWCCQEVFAGGALPRKQGNSPESSRLITSSRLRCLSFVWLCIWPVHRGSMATAMWTYFCHRCYDASIQFRVFAFCDVSVQEKFNVKFSHSNCRKSHPM